MQTVDREYWEEQHPGSGDIIDVLEMACEIANAMGPGGPILPADVLKAYEIVLARQPVRPGISYA